jgi:hypothetical protein
VVSVGRGGADHGADNACDQQLERLIIGHGSSSPTSFSESVSEAGRPVSARSGEEASFRILG